MPSNSNRGKGGMSDIFQDSILDADFPEMYGSTSKHTFGHLVATDFSFGF
jgi:hypothetical protein